MTVDCHEVQERLNEFVDLELPPGGSARVVGRVTTELGDGVPAGVVKAVVASLPFVTIQTTRIGLDGSYVFERVPPGRYSVVAHWASGSAMRRLDVSDEEVFLSLEVQ